MNKDILVFDFHRGTTHDGPGMRTTIFLKGCSLKCKWCHNPESLSTKPQLQWDGNKCIACLSCVKVCTQGALKAGKNGIEINRKICNECFECVDVCPANAMNKTGKWWNVDDLIKEACKDHMFFDAFDGGVTISGGEPLMQVDAILPLLKELKQRKISIAIDTCGQVSESAFDKVFEYTDVFLYDIKILKSENHKKWTGSRNETIINNFKHLMELISKNNSKKCWIRTPLIPYATACTQNIIEIAEFLLPFKEYIDRWELCSFNNVCKDKYKKLQIDWYFDSEPLMMASQADKYYNIARELFGEKVVLSGLTAKDE